MGADQHHKHDHFHEHFHNRDDGDRNDDIVDDHPYSYSHPHSDVEISTKWEAPRQHRWAFIDECSHLCVPLQLDFALGVAGYSVLLAVCVLGWAVMSHSSWQATRSGSSTCPFAGASDLPCSWTRCVFSIPKM